MSTMNAIAVEAYKKYILVSLIHLRQVCVFLLMGMNLKYILANDIDHQCISICKFI